jgi:hypothetical protein
MTRLILVPYGETSDPEVIRAIRTEQHVVRYNLRERSGSERGPMRDDSHLPDRALGEPNIVGHSEQSRPGDKVPCPRSVSLDDRFPVIPRPNRNSESVLRFLP